MAHRGNPHSLLPSAGSVIGREAELAEIEAFLTQTPPPAALVLAGPAGIGKTTLWQAGVAAARDGDHRVLVSRPLETDAALSLAGLSDPVEGVADEVAGELPEPQRQALNAALLREGDQPARPDPRGINAAVHGVLRATAARRPLLVAIDDLQWLDRPSMDVLRHAMRRLDEDRVRLLVAERETPQSASPNLGLSLQRVNRVDVGPLDLEEIRELLASELGRHLPLPVLERITELAGGNPFYALELCRSGDPASVGQLKGLDLQRLVGDRLARLPRDTRDALGTVAALAHPSAALVAEVLDDEAALDPAFRAGVLAEDGEQLRFAHPLLAAAAYAGLPPRHRRQAHARLAAVVRDPEERSRHLAAAAVAPDATVAAALDAGAGAADSRGAPAAAAELLERAASLTPYDDRRAAARRRLDAARDHIRAGDSRRGVDICRTLVGKLRPGPLRAEALRTLATNHQVAAMEQVEFGRQAVDECGDDSELRAQCLLSLALALITTNQWRDAQAATKEAVVSARASGSSEALIGALSVAGELEGLMTPGGGRAMLREAIALEAARVTPSSSWYPATRSACVYMVADELDEARSLLEAARQRAGDAGDQEAVLHSDVYLTEVELLAGNLARARTHAEEGLALAEQGAPSMAVGAMLYGQALVAAYAGDADLARELTARGLALANEAGDVLWPLLHQSVLGFLELSLGNPGAALFHLEPLPGQLERLGVQEPGTVPCHADVIEALIGLGRLEEAEAKLGAWEGLGHEIDRPRVLATAARARGLIAADRGDLDLAVAAFEEALGHHDRLAVPIERGRTLVALGSAYRRAGQRRKARATLEEALELFERIGTGIWVDRARAELGRLGGRAPSGDELTPTERRVAELVAEGRTNKDVAAALFVTVRTVESNLTRIYSKLGIRSRTELAARGLPSEDEPAG